MCVSQKRKPDAALPVVASAVTQRHLYCFPISSQGPSGGRLEPSSDERRVRECAGTSSKSHTRMRSLLVMVRVKAGDCQRRERKRAAREGGRREQTEEQNIPKKAEQSTAIWNAPGHEIMS